MSYHFSLFVAGILLPSPVLEEGLGVRVINYLCHYFRKMVSERNLPQESEAIRDVNLAESRAWMVMNKNQIIIPISTRILVNGLNLLPIIFGQLVTKRTSFMQREIIPIKAKRVEVYRNILLIMNLSTMRI